jgi:16S rRNA (guanine527-N7)-methyltransferase
MRIPQTNSFMQAMSDHEASFGVDLTAEQRERLGEYFELVMHWNPRLHLVAPCSPDEFATRHALESLIAARHLTKASHVTDIGSGAGLPIIPCLINRADIRATLIEASQKKAVFLSEAITRLNLGDRATVIMDRFEKVPSIETDYVSCRALDKFGELLPTIIDWSPENVTLLLFGGQSIREQIQSSGLSYDSIHIPGSDRRFLFVAKKTPGRH